MKMPDDCTVRMVDLPAECGGMVSMSPDGHYNIYLNARLDHETQRKKFQHEVAHIENNDFFNDDPIEVVEARADGHSGKLKSIPNLMRARDLLPPAKPQKPAPVQKKRRELTPHQTAVLLRAVADLDAWYFKKQYDI